MSDDHEMPRIGRILRAAGWRESEAYDLGDLVTDTPTGQSYVAVGDDARWRVNFTVDPSDLIILHGAASLAACSPELFQKLLDHPDVKRLAIHLDEVAETFDIIPGMVDLPIEAEQAEEHRGQPDYLRHDPTKQGGRVRRRKGKR